MLYLYGAWWCHGCPGEGGKYIHASSKPFALSYCWCVPAQALHYWFSWLHRTLPGESVTAVGRRLLIDQFMFAPCFIPSFMATLHLLEGSAQPLTDAQTKWWDTVQANWRLWVPAQLINFGLVPVHFQVLFANGVAVFWNVYLSWATHSTASAVVAADADKA